MKLTRAEARRRLRRAVHGTLGEWIGACEDAFDSGLTSIEVRMTLLRYHYAGWTALAVLTLPVTLFVAYAFLIYAAVIVASKLR